MGIQLLIMRRDCSLLLCALLVVVLTGAVVASSRRHLHLHRRKSDLSENEAPKVKPLKGKKALSGGLDIAGESNERSAGTIGGVLCLKSDLTKKYVVTNAHVLKVKDENACHPAPVKKMLFYDLDCKQKKSCCEPIGKVILSLRIASKDNSDFVTMDVALAELDTATTDGIGAIAGVDGFSGGHVPGANGMKVIKSGAVTGVTEGVLQVTQPLPPSYSGKFADTDYQIIPSTVLMRPGVDASHSQTMAFNSAKGELLDELKQFFLTEDQDVLEFTFDFLLKHRMLTYFSSGGDSGSLVLDNATGKVVCLLYTGMWVEDSPSERAFDFMGMKVPPFLRVAGCHSMERVLAVIKEETGLDLDVCLPDK